LIFIKKKESDDEIGEGGGGWWGERVGVVSVNWTLQNFEFNKTEKDLEKVLRRMNIFKNLKLNDLRCSVEK